MFKRQKRKSLYSGKSNSDGQKEKKKGFNGYKDRLFNYILFMDAFRNCFVFTESICPIKHSLGNNNSGGWVDSIAHLWGFKYVQFL